MKTATNRTSTDSVISSSRIFWRTIALMLFLVIAQIIYRQSLTHLPSMSLVDLMTHIRPEHLVNPALIWELSRFAAVTVGLYLLWVYLIYVSTLPWLTKPISDSARTLIWLNIFFLHTLLFLLLNSYLMPTSLLAVFRSTAYASLPVIIVLTSIVTGLLVYGLLYRFKLQGTLIISAALSVLLIQTQPDSIQENNPTDLRPNVILIGIDGLRTDHLQYRGAEAEQLPFLNKLLAGAEIYDRSYTPMARTYVAWMSLLKGQYPVTHGARFNLTHPESIDRHFPLLEQLKNQGYSSIYAMDERRFNQIDKSYGFNTVIGPRLGAADALIAHNADLPLINLALESPFAHFLYPYLYLNRAYGKGYDPIRFNNKVLSQLTPDTPNFMAVHFCMLHWPYTSREFVSVNNYPWQGNYNHFMYRVMLARLDLQLSHFYSQLKSAGYLENAIVYLFSDHGEGFRLQQDQLLNPLNPESERPEVNSWGHGTNLLNLPQNDILLARLHYINNKPSHQVGLKQGNFSLVDIAPSLTKNLNLTADKFDGRPLDSISGDKQRSVYAESAISIKSINTSFIDDKAVFIETGSRYEISDQGLPHLRQDIYEEMISLKQRSVYLDNWQLTLLPGYEQPILTDMANKQWHYLKDYQGTAPWDEMLTSLCSHFSNDPGIDESYCASRPEKIQISQQDN